MLIPEKLTNIRNKLLRDPDFIFPGSILVVLSAACSYDTGTGNLSIPRSHGALTVVDGQHRLFAYAHDAVESIMGDDCQILVTALCFEEAESEEVARLSARTFIEINVNQTKVSKLHLEGIAYEVLRDTGKRAIAAHVLRKANERQNKLRGLLITADSPTGKIKIMEIVSAVALLTDVQKIARLGGAGAAAARRRAGYDALFAASVDELSDPNVLAEKGIICIERYTNLLAKTFEHDWPIPGESLGSALELSKVFAGLVRLLNQFVDEGLNWRQVEAELLKIRSHVLSLRGKHRYRSLLLDVNETGIPDGQPRATEDFRFFNANRTSPTPIEEATGDS